MLPVKPKPEYQQQLLWRYVSLTENEDSTRAAQLRSEGVPEEYVLALMVDMLSPQEAFRGFQRAFLNLAAAAYVEQKSLATAKKQLPFRERRRKQQIRVETPSTDLINEITSHYGEHISESALIESISKEKRKEEKFTLYIGEDEYNNSYNIISYFQSQQNLTPLTLPEGEYYYGLAGIAFATRYVNRIAIAFALDGTAVSDQDNTSTPDDTYKISPDSWEKAVFGTRKLCSNAELEQTSSFVAT